MKSTLLHMALTALMMLIAERSAHAQKLVAKEEALKAAFTVKFLRFVVFPKESAKRVLCVSASQDIRNIFYDFQSKSAQLRSLDIVPLNDLSQASQCNIIYVSQSSPLNPEELLTTLESAPTLTVGDTAEFCRRGGMIQLLTEKTNIRFDINLKQARSAGLDIRSGLLNLARKVITK